MEEGIVDRLLLRLETEENSLDVLVDFYCELLGSNDSVSARKVIGKLLKVYGGKRLFYGILSLYDVESFDPNGNIYPLLSYFIKKQLDNQVIIQDCIDVEGLEARMKKAKRVKFDPDLFSEGINDL